MHRQLIRVLVAVAVVLSLSAGAAAAAKTTLEIWHTWHYDFSYGKIFNALLEEFRKANPDIVVEEMVLTPKDMDAKMLVGAAAGVLPDITWGRPFTYLEAGVPLLVLDPMLNQTPSLKRDVMPQLWNAVTRNGKAYALPIEMSPTSVNFQHQMFAEAGLPVPSEQKLDDWTWGRFNDLARKLSKDTNGDGRNDQWGFVMAWQLRTWSLFLRSVGGDIFDNSYQPTKATTVSDAGRISLSFLREMVASGAMFPQHSWNSIRNRGYAMDVNGVWTVTTYFDSNVTDFSSWPPPRYENGKFENYLHINSLMIVNKGDAAKQAAAWRFLSWFYSPEVHTRWAVNSGYLPVLRSTVSSNAFASIRNNPAYRGHIMALDLGTPATEHVTTGKGNEALSQANVTGTMTDVLTGKISVDEGLIRMETAINGVLQAKK